jgi:CRISPR system Cascade subunit CasE
MAFSGDQRRTHDPFFLDTWPGPDLPEPKPGRCEAGFLFRIERDGDPRILVQSVQRPDWDYAFQNAPYLLADKARVLTFEPTPQSGQAYRFRLLANVVRIKRVVDASGRTRTSHAGITFTKTRRAEIPVHLNPIPDPLPTDPTERRRIFAGRWDPWRDWLNQLASIRGFRVVDAENSPVLMEKIWTSVRRRAEADGSGQMDIRFNAGLFEGAIICTEPDLMRRALASGIGPAKAFGFGLLSIAPLR